MLKGLIERGLAGVRLVISDDHESIKQAVKVGIALGSVATMRRRL